MLIINMVYFNNRKRGIIMKSQRKIIHIDMDAFYASIEQRDNPSLRGKPVIVGGNPQGRGVVATCSYEARQYGIHSAMPCKIAYKRCPYAIFVRPRFEVYKQVSYEIRQIFESIKSYQKAHRGAGSVRRRTHRNQRQSRQTRKRRKSRRRSDRDFRQQFDVVRSAERRRTSNQAKCGNDVQNY